jgi:hypothetical protein
MYKPLESLLKKQLTPRMCLFIASIAPIIERYSPHGDQYQCITVFQEGMIRRLCAYIVAAHWSRMYTGTRSRSEMVDLGCTLVP